MRTNISRIIAPINLVDWGAVVAGIVIGTFIICIVITGSAQNAHIGESLDLCRDITFLAGALYGSQCRTKSERACILGITIPLCVMLLVSHLSTPLFSALNTRAAYATILAMTLLGALGAKLGLLINRAIDFLL